MVNSIPTTPEMPEASDILEENRKRIEEYIQSNILGFSVIKIYFSKEKEDSLCMLGAGEDGYMYLITALYDLENKVISDFKHEQIG